METILEVADIPLCPGLQVCSTPRSFLPLRILPQGSRGFYIRAYRALLPPHAPDMLTVRTQAIDSTGTFTLPDLSSLVGCSHRSRPFLALSFASVTLSLDPTSQMDDVCVASVWRANGRALESGTGEGRPDPCPSSKRLLALGNRWPPSLLVSRSVGIPAERPADLWAIPH